MERKRTDRFVSLISSNPDIYLPMVTTISSLENEPFFKISKVQGCKLTRVGDLPFDFDAGGCNTFEFGIMMCFSYYDDKECHS